MPNEKAVGPDIRKAIDDMVGSNPDTVADILEALALACEETADHVAINWQDRRGCESWLKIAGKIHDTLTYFEHNKPY